MMRPRPLSRRTFHRGCLAGLAWSCLLLSGSALADLPAPGSPTLRAILAARKVRVGLCPGFAPFVVAGGEIEGFVRLIPEDRPAPRVSKDGQRIVGLDVDLAGLLAQALGVELETVVVARFDDLFDILGKGEVDAVLSGVTRTLGRARSLSFSQPYLISGQEVYTRQAARFPSLQAVNQPGIKVGAKQGTTGEGFVRETFGNATYLPQPDSDALFSSLDVGALDIAVADGLVGRDRVLRNKARGPLTSVEQRRVTSESIAMVARQGDTDWTDYLSLLVREARLSGQFHRIAHRYNPWLRAER